MKKLIAALSLTSALSVPAAAQSVLTYHNSQSRAGTYRMPGLTLSAAATIVPTRHSAAQSPATSMPSR